MIKYNVNEFVSEKDAKIITFMVEKGATRNDIGARFPSLKSSNIAAIILRLGL